jgi:hypothetical protein
MSKRRLAPSIAVLSLALSACSSAGTSSDAGVLSDAGASSAQDSGVSGTPLLGSFQVTLVVPADNVAGYTTVAGKVSDGPTPTLPVWKKSVIDGHCALLVPRNAFCTSCSGVCVDDETCELYPTAKSVGTATVTGLRTSAGPVQETLGPGPGDFYQLVDELPFPAFDEGGEISVATSGGDYPAFTVKSTGILPLELTNDTITVAQNQPLTLTWTKPSISGLSQIAAVLEIAHHGGVKANVTCATSDSGSLTISASLVTQLIAKGVAGYPTVTVTRSAVGSTPVGSGRVELQVLSSVERQVTIPGVISCTEDSDCPDGRTCDKDGTKTCSP